MSLDLRIRVLIVDESPLIRGALLALLSGDPRFQIVGAYENMGAVITFGDTSVDIVLVDVPRPDDDLADVLEQILLRFPAARPMIYSSRTAPSVVQEAMTGGAVGYVAKSDSVAEVVSAMLAVAGGSHWISPHLRGSLEPPSAELSQAVDESLSATELAILRMVANGATDVEIGEQLFISTRTVQNVLARIRRITGSRERTALTRWAVARGLA